MNAMDLMKALGDIPEELVKTCFDEEFADNKTKAPSDTNSSDLPELADPYQPEETDDDNSTSSNKSGAKHIHFSGYIATVAACLAIVIAYHLMIHLFRLEVRENLRIQLLPKPKKQIQQQHIRIKALHLYLLQFIQQKQRVNIR